MKRKYFISAFIGFILVSIYGKTQESYPELNNLVPPSPTAASLGMYAELPVSLYTGTPNINIPIWEVNGRKLSIDISLNYHASGIRVNDIAGWVGLGWSLQAGGIVTRTVRGIADDLPSGYLTLDGNQLPLIGQDPDVFGRWEPPGSDESGNIYLSEIVDGRADSEPDVFYFNLNGRSGKIILNSNREPVVIPHQNLDITYDTNLSGSIISWQIIDEEGRIYILGTPEAVEVSTPISKDGTRQRSFISSWYLKQIVTPNSDDAIRFTYIDNHTNRRDPIPQRKFGNEDPNEEDLVQYNQTEIEGKFLREITYSKGFVVFDTLTLHTLSGRQIHGLKRITIKDLFSRNRIKIFYFDYSFFQTESYGRWYDYLPPSERLRLDKITEISSSGKVKHPPYMFFYDSTPLPPRGSYAQDHWGYFNGAENEYFIPELIVRNYSNYESIPPMYRNPRGENIEKLNQVNLNLPQLSENIWRTRGADREPNAEFMQAGILNRIVYPTGGSTIFEYEPHDYGFISMPRKPVQTKVLVSYKEQNNRQQENSRLLDIAFNQKIKIVPLFYILRGSIKDKGPGKDDIPPSDFSRVYLVSEPGIDEQPDTLFNLSFSDLKSSVAGMEAEYYLWIKKGIYELGVIADEEGDYTELRIYSDSESQFDETYPIYSSEYKKTTIMAGEKTWIDEESQYRSEVVEITHDDENLIKIEIHFSSAIHPDHVSFFGLEIPISKVSIKDINNHGNLIFESFYYGNNPIKWDKDQNIWIQEFSLSRFFEPGIYLVEFIPRISSETGYISLTWNKAVNTHNFKIAGGVRLKRVLEIDNISDIIEIRDFDYTMYHHDIYRSSGVLQSWPVYYDLPDEIFYLDDEGNPSNISYPPLTQYSSGRNYLGSTQGSHIGYRQVTESKPGSGKTVYKFTSSWEFPDITCLLFPFPKATSYDWKRGLNKETIKFSEEGKVREIETFKYNQLEDTSHLIYIPSFVVARKFPEPNSPFVYEKYMNVSSWTHPEEQNITRFDVNGENPLQSSKRFEYNPDHLQLNQILQFDSDGSEYFEKLYYPVDEEVESSETIREMVNRHMVNIILKREVIRNKQLIAGTKTNFDIFNETQIYPSSTEELEGSRYVIKMLFDKYDNKGNLLQYHMADDLCHSINWGWNGNYPVAEISNSVYKDDINNYLNDSRITKYTYLPLVGVSSITAPDGLNTYYEYDDFGRLTVVKNHDHNILKSINYHYKDFQGDTSRTYWISHNLSASLPPDYILSDMVVLPRNCTAHLTVSGGLLGTNAQWIWYKESCGRVFIDTGSEIEVSPATTTTYFVRAEGEANQTVCRSLTIEVIPASFNLLQAELLFNHNGNAGNPSVIEVNYTGCDPWSVTTNSEWLTIASVSENNFSVACDKNDNLTTRKGGIYLFGDGNEFILPVHQSGSIFLEINYEPETVISGDDVFVTATVINGSSPYEFIWEIKLTGDENWTIVRNNPVEDSSDILLIPSVITSFEVRCSVVSGGETISKEILIIVAE